MWSGLGYYPRPSSLRQVIVAAKTVVEAFTINFVIE
jgi:hypothetical protein